MLRRWWLGVLALVLLTFLYVPIVVAVVYAFNDSYARSWPPAGFTLRWFESLVADEQLVAAFRTSVAAAVASAVLATAIGTAAALVFSRRSGYFETLFAGFARLPIMLPPLFIAIGILAIMTAADFSPSLGTVIAGHTVIAVPFVIAIISARLLSYDLELEQAARDLGAGPAQVIRRVTIPILGPAMIGSLLLAFAFSFHETLITYLTSGTIVTVPVYVLGKLRRFFDPSVNAIAVVLLLIPWVAFAAAALILRRSGDTDAGKALVRS